MLKKITSLNEIYVLFDDYTNCFNSELSDNKKEELVKIINILLKDIRIMLIF